LSTTSTLPGAKNPVTLVELPENQANEVLGLIDRLEQDDDVQKVFHSLG